MARLLIGAKPDLLDLRVPAELTADTVSCSVWLLRLTQLLWRRGTAVKRRGTAVTLAL
jgi:hypothetical protein